MHFNLHKTFSTPHGGGGPGSGPVACKKILEPYLPTPQVVKTEHGFARNYNIPNTVGQIHGYYGSFLCVLRAYVYILYYGRERLKQVAENAVLNANYIRVSLQNYYDVAYNELCMHECIFTAKRQQKEHGVRALDIAKRLMDYGYHPPTIYFPLIVAEAMMIEPTETESLQTLDSFIASMIEIAREIEEDPEIVKSAPHITPVRKLDEATAARNPCLCWSPPTGVMEEPQACDALAMA
jgi:glycine dehydrogenase subunit 2